MGFVLLLFTHASLLCYMAVRQTNAGDFIQYSRCGIWFHGREGGTSTRIWEKLRFLTGLNWCWQTRKQAGLQTCTSGTDESTIWAGTTILFL